MWDRPTRDCQSGQQERIVVPDAKPGDIFAYEDCGHGHFHLVRLKVPTPNPKKMTRLQVRKAIATSKLMFEMSWDELREMTREP
jgi:hypothetical protein